MTLQHEFPRLTERNHRVTSAATPDYNCVAWSAGDVDHWWQPGVFWPIETPPTSLGIDVLRQAFASLGYENCDDGLLESDYDKVALYASASFYTHVARQLHTGWWTSKLGRSEDIEHESPETLSGGVYGDVVQFMKRRRDSP
jgi:hypothetical protein